MATSLVRTRGGGRLAVATLLALALLAGACSSSSESVGSTGSAGPAGSSTTGPKPTASTVAPTPTGDAANLPAGGALGLRLSQGKAQVADPEPVPLIEGDPVAQTRIDELLSRLPAWGTDDPLGTDFKFPTQTLPAPRTGATIDVQFPAAEATPPPEVVSGPLQVLRYQPEGNVPAAGFISVTFSQPMVPIGTVAQVDAQNVPVTITPAIAGRWQWIGTKTLRFDYTSDLFDRLPMATDYSVVVPAGTVSATGSALETAVSWKFSTPPVTVLSFSPQDVTVDLEPIFIATFDQRVDPQAALNAITLKAGDNSVATRIATAAEIQADATVQSTIGAVQEGRWIAFRATAALPNDSQITVIVGPGTPSLEGPKLSDAQATYRVHTYAPLKVIGPQCSNDNPCPPGSEVDIEMNNSLDTKAFDPTTIRVEPALTNMVVGASGTSINIRGTFQGQTDYKIVVPSGVSDVYGQTLGTDTPVDVKIGTAPPSIAPFEQPFTTLDPLAKTQSIGIRTVNHDDLRVRVFKVSPSDWGSYVTYSQNAFNGDPKAPSLPNWPVLTDQTIPSGGQPDQLVETSIDLSKALGGNPGHVVVLVESTTTYPQDSELYYSNRPTITWAQSTNIGLDAMVDSKSLLVWATELKSGSPLGALPIQLGGTTTSVTTDAQGLVTADLSANAIDVLTATKGDDTAILPQYYYGGGWQRSDQADDSRWYVFDDRQIYRPGEKVSLKGWVRRFTSGSAQIATIGAGTSIGYTVNDSQGNEITKGDLTPNALGGFNMEFAIPDGANLGYGTVNFTLTNATGIGNGFYSHNFQIEEFRRPEFEVTARNESAGPYVTTKPATVAVDAKYYSGGPLAAAPVVWNVTTSSASYSPPNWDKFTFGVWTPWWYSDFGGPTSVGSGVVDRSYPIEGPCCGPTGDTSVATFTGVTGNDGTHLLQIDFEKPKGAFPDLPVTVSANASVQDLNRQTWASTTSLLVHPGQFYVGLRSDRTFVRQGEPLKIEAIVTDIDGKAVAGRTFKVTASRLTDQFVDGQWKQLEADAQTCELTSTDAALSCNFDTSKGGTMKIASTIADDNGGRSRSELTRWISGGDARPSRSVQQEALTLVPDQPEYKGGDTAQLLVQAPFATGEGLVTVSRVNITSTIRFQVSGGSAVVSIPIKDTDVPNVNLSIEVVGTTPRVADDGTPLATAAPRPAYAVGGLSLSVPPTARDLAVAITPAADKVEPGVTTSVDVAVTDSAGKPVAGAEMAVVVVDEAVLALSGYTLADPLDTFYSQLYPNLQTRYGRDSIVLVDPASLAAQNGSATSTTFATADTAAAELDNPAPASAPPLAGGAPTDAARTADSSKSASAVGAVDPGAPIDVRTNFDALAVFKPEVVTDADGKATIEVPLPDNLTRYRVMVVAVANDQHFGSAESNITARLPLMVRPSAPRFLNFGDTFELPAILQNQTDRPMDVDVVLQTANLTSTGQTGKHVTIPANNRIEVRFPVAADRAGTARFRIAAATSDNAAADAATVELPVYTPATAEAFATYGVVDDGSIAQPLLAPTDVIAQFGGLEITTSSTSLQALTDAAIYINDYPYDSADGIASRILGITSLRDVLDAFHADGLPDAATLNAKVKADIARLAALQASDGGFGYWDLRRGSDPFVSIQATHALVMAKAAGYAVPQQTLNFAMLYLQNIEQNFPSYITDQKTRDTLSAYALNVRNLNSERDVSKAQALYDRAGDTLGLDAVAWLWPVIDDPATDAAIEKLFNNRAVETAGAANFSTDYGDGANFLLYSDRRTDGIVLDALIAKRPQSDLIPKVVNGLLGSKVKGRWDNIQENSFILLALKRYFDVYENATPEFVARVWLGDQFAGEQTFSGRSTDRNRLNIPTSALIEKGDTNIIVSKDGTGRLYYRLGLRYAPASLTLAPLDRGFEVSRTYEGVDNPDDVTRDTDGTWHIKAGARVRVNLSIVAESQRNHVALIDPLPAGLEILNPSLAVTEDIPVATGDTTDTTDIAAAGRYPDSWWYGVWFDHQNMRDDRAEAFSNLLPAGTYSYSYVARATTPGTFVTPPTRAEEMYAPETFGRAATDRVVVDS